MHKDAAEENLCLSRLPRVVHVAAAPKVASGGQVGARDEILPGNEARGHDEVERDADDLEDEKAAADALERARRAARRLVIGTVRRAALVERQGPCANDGRVLVAAHLEDVRGDEKRERRHGNTGVLANLRSTVCIHVIPQREFLIGMLRRAVRRVVHHRVHHGVLRRALEAVEAKEEDVVDLNENHEHPGRCY